MTLAFFFEEFSLSLPCKFHRLMAVKVVACHDIPRFLVLPVTSMYFISLLS